MGLFLLFLGLFLISMSAFAFSYSFFNETNRDNLFWFYRIVDFFSFCVGVALLYDYFTL